MRETLILAGLLAGFACPLAAQDAGPPGTAPDAMPEARPVDRKKAMAAKLAGLVDFANTSCPDVQGDTVLLKAAVQRLGIDPQDLDQGELALMVGTYLETYRRDVPENCKRAIDTFGATSRIVPNLIVKR